MHDRRERNREQRQPNRAQPQIRDTIPIHRQRHAHAAEKQHREDPLPQRHVHVVRNERPGVPHDVLRGRVRIDRVTRPVGRMEAAQREQHEKPRAAKQHDQDATD